MEKEEFYICEGKDIGSVIAGPLDEKSWLKYRENLVSISEANLPQLKELFIYRKTSNDYYLRERHLYYKEDIKNLGFVYSTINFDLMKALKASYYISDEIYTSPETIEKAERFIRANPKPLVVEGTQWPYFFEFEGDYFPSQTSSFGKYLLKTYNIINKNTLVNYSGKDLCNEGGENGTPFLFMRIV